MPRYELRKATQKGKKWQIKTPEGKTIPFGFFGMEDFTTHKDEERKQRYLSRHKKNEDWSDKNTAGFWSRHLLWSEPTLAGSIKKVNEKFNIHVVKVR
jgi:hypothetical protein